MKPVLFIGGGNMARAIIDGATSGGVLGPDLIGVVEPDESRRAGFVRGVPNAAAGVQTLRELEDAPGAGSILLAVKPQKLEEVGAELAPLLAREPRCLISILAGVTIERLRQALGAEHRYIRAMPNTPAQIGRGMSALAGDGNPQDLEFAKSLFSSLGEIIVIDESMMDAFTAVAGSGPAYAFLLAEAMVEAARAMGFDESQARLVVSETIAGAGLLLARNHRDPSALRVAVTSPGGTTAAALEVMTEGSLPEIVVRALEAARARGAELGRRGT